LSGLGQGGWGGVKRKRELRAVIMTINKLHPRQLICDLRLTFFISNEKT
jgi:hypothetical protein